MSLNYYQAETDGQTASMNGMCQAVILAMEKTVESIQSFQAAENLQGDAYHSAKGYMAEVYRPLAYGMIQLCEELITQNEQYPRSFQSQVSTDDVEEQQIIDQIAEVDRYLQKLTSSPIPIPGSSIVEMLFNHMKRSLEQKLEQLRTFETTSGGMYDTALQLVDYVLTGLAEVQNGGGFNRETGTFSTNGMDLAWAIELETIHYTVLAKEKYGDYLESPEGDLEKAVEIVRYEEENPTYVNQTDSFLEPLEDRDIIEIKYLMYTADEPHRTLAMQYLDQIEINSITSSGSYTPDTKQLKFNVVEDRTNRRGPYFTFFHELGHAIDYNMGEEYGYDGPYSEHHRQNGQSLSDLMFADVEQTIRAEVRNELKKPTYEGLSPEERTAMEENITNDFIYRGPSNQTLTADEEQLSGVVQTAISRDLTGDEHNNASDIYGAVTALEISGNWGHHNLSYWVDETTGERVRGPEREGFASYYSVHMIEAGELRDSQFESHEGYLSQSKEHMDQMFDQMG